MARGFRIHSNAVFNPFSYQELIAPIQDYQQAYDQMQDVMLAAGEEANQYKQLIDTDEYASGILKGYNDALSDMSGRLSSEGLKAVNRNSLLSLRRKYNDEVKPINDAAKTLASLQDMYRQAYAKDQTMMRGAMPSIRDLVENPGATPQMVSGVQLYNQGSAASKSASLRNFSETEFGRKIIRGYIEKAEEIGYSPELVRAFMQDASAIPELAAEIANIQQMYSTGTLQNPEQANRFIMQGILDGIQYQRKTDYKYDQLGAEMRAAARAKAASGADDLSSLNKLLKPFNQYSQNERSAAARNISNFESMFTQNADRTWRINDKGRADLRKEAYSKPAGTSITGATQGQIPFDSGMKKVLEDYAGRSLNSEKDIEDAWTKYYNEHQNEAYDAHKATAYRYIPQSDDLKVAQNAVETLGNRDKKGNLITYDYDTRRNQFVESGSVNSSDIKSFSDIEISGSGIMVNAITKDDKIVKFKLPASQSYYDFTSATQNAQRLKESELKWRNTLTQMGNALYESGAPISLTADSSPEEAIYVGGLLGGQAGAQAVYQDYLNYQRTQKAIYDSVSNMLRTIDSTAAKL